MKRPLVSHPSDWIVGVILGLGLGLTILGIGGRIAMRGVAVWSGQPGGFSLGGTLTVVGLGAFSGGVGGLAFVGLRRLLPARRVLRAVLFWSFCFILALRALHPLDAMRAVLFFPLVVLYAGALYGMWCRVYWPWRTAQSASLTRTAPA